jgi:hypothetical protein
MVQYLPLYEAASQVVSATTTALPDKGYLTSVPVEVPVTTVPPQAHIPYVTHTPGKGHETPAPTAYHTQTPVPSAQPSGYETAAPVPTLVPEGYTPTATFGSPEATQIGLYSGPILNSAAGMDTMLWALALLM